MPSSTNAKLGLLFALVEVPLVAGAIGWTFAFGSLVEILPFIGQSAVIGAPLFLLVPFVIPLLLFKGWTKSMSTPITRPRPSLPSHFTRCAAFYLSLGVLAWLMRQTGQTDVMGPEVAIVASMIALVGAILGDVWGAHAARLPRPRTATDLQSRSGEGAPQ